MSNRQANNPVSLDRSPSNPSVNANDTKPKPRRKLRYQGSRNTPVFKGKVADMEGNVFHLANERKKKDQFDDTLKA